MQCPGPVSINSVYALHRKNGACIQFASSSLATPSQCLGQDNPVYRTMAHSLSLYSGTEQHGTL